MFRYVNNALKSVQNIDKNFKALGEQAATAQKINTLVEKLDQNPEVKQMLSKFMIDLNKIGINQTIKRDQVPQIHYYIRILKFKQLHSVFWELCKENDISQHNHRLSYNVNNLGLLDPNNFPSNVYKSLINQK